MEMQAFPCELANIVPNESSKSQVAMYTPVTVLILLSCLFCFLVSVFIVAGVPM